MSGSAEGGGLVSELYLVLCSDSMYSAMLCFRGRDTGSSILLMSSSEVVSSVLGFFKLCQSEELHNKCIV